MAIYCPECGQEIKEGGTCGCPACSRQASKPAPGPGAPADDSSAGNGGLNIGLGILIMLFCMFLIWPAGVTAAYRTVVGWLPESVQEHARHVPAWRLTITLLGAGIALSLFRMNRRRT